MDKILILLYVAMTASGLITLKLGSADGAPISFVDGRLDFNLNFINILGVIMYGVSFLLYIYLISKNDLGYIIPVTTAMVYCVIFIASFVVFHESFTLIKIIGISMILIGVMLINANK